jgi:glucosamine-6-phosphate deaminase
MAVAAKERIRTEIFATDREASRQVARIIAAEIRKANVEGRAAVLGLATGSTPIGVYRQLIWMHNPKALRSEGETAEQPGTHSGTQSGTHAGAASPDEEFTREFGKLSFKNVYTFNLDEYYPMSAEALQSYRRWMRENFFDYIDIPAGNIFIPDGTTPRERIEDHCRWYEDQIRKLGGIDLQILGIGRTGHIGFNEPGSPRDSRTRLVMLDPLTRKDAAADFFGEEHVPREAVTMGVGTILSARRIIIMAFGEHKAKIVKRTVEGPTDPDVPATFLQDHPNTLFYVDRAAACDLTRIRTPWRVRPMEWTDEELKKAVISLALEKKKGILKLTALDYADFGLHDLVARRGPVEALNKRVFRHLQGKINEYPGGGAPVGQLVAPGAAPGAGALPAVMGEPAMPKRVLCFSPHPDDDVISMGGTLIRLCKHGHDVHIAYQTSGNIAVFDHAVRRLMDFLGEVNQIFEIDTEQTRALREKVTGFMANKRAGEVDSDEVQKIKTIIRRSEARAGAIHAGVPEANCHFLEMPFYKTGKVAKKPLSKGDFEAVAAVIAKVRPDIIFLAGDLSDPHGTHRMCADAIFHVLRGIPEWNKRMEVWLYRGAWQEWEPAEVDMVVPLSAEELMQKRFAIFKHESQKDTAMFPGRDSREFWQRAEDRNKNTAALFDQLGLPEFFAMEGFVRLTPEMLR